MGGVLQVPLAPGLMLDLQLECARFLHETLLVPVLMYGRDNVLSGEGEILHYGCTDEQPQRIPWI